NKKGACIIENWMKPLAVDMVCNIIHEEMDLAKPHLRMTTQDITPDYIATWDINEIMGPVATMVTPVWTRVLDCASETRQTKAQQVGSGHESNRQRSIGCHIISSQVHFLRSLKSCKVQIALGLSAWAMGASRQLIGILHQSSLSLSYPSILTTLSSLADRSIENARRAADGPHGLAYDNINMSTSIFVEQTSNMMNKVQSGTFGVIYELFNAKKDDILLAPIMTRLKSAPLMTMKDLRPTADAVSSYSNQCAINIVKILMKYVKSFSCYKDDPSLQNAPRRRLPDGYKTKFYPLHASTIEEASTKGNILVHEDIYISQLAIRKKNLTPWTQREIFQLGLGLFHLLMNLIWALLNVHRGAINQLGSLSHFFAVLEKTRLGAAHPDFHTLLAALTQILDGLILNAWRRECPGNMLDEFANGKPTAVDLLKLARQILRKYATPHEDLESPNSNATPSPNSNHLEDIIHENITQLTRDLLYVVELVNAIADGDFGHIEDILPDIAFIFRGSGSNNYSTEILHFLFNLKHVWTPEFANIMRDNLLINISGLPGHAMGIDMNIEHLIWYLKALFAAKGMYSNWERGGDISAAIDNLQTLKKQIAKSFKISYQGSTHSDVDTSDLVWRIANTARDLKIQECVYKTG
ncbi:hypothetical protein BD779DRAFT_1452195, partial [Infundibulicybe gibba]